jgi:hypothetical protein
VAGAQGGPGRLRFGAEERNDALQLSRPELLIQLEAVRAGSTYTSFLQKRRGVAQQLHAARAEASARQFRVRPAVVEERQPRLEDLPKTITWRRDGTPGPGRFEILYDDGADLMAQLAEFLRAAGLNRLEFLAAVEPAHEP